MSEVLVKVIGGLIRVLMAPVALWLIRRGIITSNESVNFVADVVAIGVPAVWSVIAWVQSHRTQNTLAAIANMTPMQVKRQMESGHTAPAISPQNEVPEITPPNFG